MFHNVDKAASKMIYTQPQLFMHLRSKAILKHIHQGKADEKAHLTNKN